MDFPYHTPLPADVQARLGLSVAEPLAMADRVRFAELDMLKHVNNTAYLQWFETVRVKYSQIYGLTRYQGNGNGNEPRIVIRSAAIHYKQEMLLNEDYVVTCRCRAYRTTSFTMAQQLWSGGTLRATFECVLVLLSPDGSRRHPIPKDVCDRFAEIDGAVCES